MDGIALVSNDFQKMQTTVLLMIMLFQRHNRLFQKEHDIPIMLLSMREHGKCENEPTID